MMYDEGMELRFYVMYEGWPVCILVVYVYVTT